MKWCDDIIKITLDCFSVLKAQKDGSKSGTDEGSIEWHNDSDSHDDDVGHHQQPADSAPCPPCPPLQQCQQQEQHPQDHGMRHSNYPSQSHFTAPPKKIRLLPSQPESSRAISDLIHAADEIEIGRHMSGQMPTQMAGPMSGHISHISGQMGGPMSGPSNHSIGHFM